jgi:hypothetical protein
VKNLVLAMVVTQDAWEEYDNCRTSSPEGFLDGQVGLILDLGKKNLNDLSLARTRTHVVGIPVDCGP